MTKRSRVRKSSGKSRRKRDWLGLTVVWPELKTGPYPRKITHIPFSALAGRHFEALRAFASLSRMCEATFLSRGIAFQLFAKNAESSESTRRLARGRAATFSMRAESLGSVPLDVRLGRKYLNLFDGLWVYWTPRPSNVRGFGLYRRSKRTSDGWLEAWPPDSDF